MEKKQILVVEDNRKLSHLFEQALCERFETRCAGSLKEARAHLSRVHGAVLDLLLPDGEGIEIIPGLLRENPGCVIVMVTAYGTIPKAVDAMRLGARHFLEKPVDLDALLDLFTSCLATAPPAGKVIAESDAMKGVLALADRVAPTPFPVLITGETGTGKEVLARYIHEQSGRAPFISVNCANLTTELADSTLFGHLRGSFTGAVEARDGLVSAADGGTLFLDEIGDLPGMVQPKLLRYLDSGVFLPIGSPRERTSSARIIAATNRDLAKAVADGAFREDLYYRLSSFPVRIPPLRDRKEDILPIAAHHLVSLETKLGLRPVLLPDAEEILMACDFPGNVRELFNILDRAAVISGGRISADTLAGIIAPGEIRREEPVPGDFWKESRAEAMKREQELIETALKAAGGNKSQAARVLGVSYKTLLNRMKQIGL